MGHLFWAEQEEDFHDMSFRTDIAFQLCQAECQKGEIYRLMALRLVL